MFLMHELIVVENSLIGKSKNIDNIGLHEFDVCYIKKR